MPKKNDPIGAAMGTMKGNQLVRDMKLGKRPKFDGYNSEESMMEGRKFREEKRMNPAVDRILDKPEEQDLFKKRRRRALGDY